jgi:hypothetical protein
MCVFCTIAVLLDGQVLVPLLEKRRAPLWVGLNCRNREGPQRLNKSVELALWQLRRRNPFVSVHFEKDSAYEESEWQPRRLHNAAWSAAALAVACLRAQPTVLARSVLPLIPSVIALSDRACDATRGVEKKASALMELPFARWHCARPLNPPPAAPRKAAIPASASAALAAATATAVPVNTAPAKSSGDYDHDDDGWSDSD